MAEILESLANVGEFVGELPREVVHGGLADVVREGREDLRALAGDAPDVYHARGVVRRGGAVEEGESDVETDVVNKFGFVNPGPRVAEDGRPELGRNWPYDRKNNGVRTGSSHILKLSKVPRRIVYKMGTQKCLTAVQPPAVGLH